MELLYSQRPKDAVQPPLGQAAQPSATPAQGPVIKDPAEYNAYVAATAQKDPKAEISGLEAFLTQYPNSIMKTSRRLTSSCRAIRRLATPLKSMDAAKRVLAAEPRQRESASGC